MTDEALRRRYLEAMDLPVWVLRSRSDVAPASAEAPVAAEARSDHAAEPIATRDTRWQALEAAVSGCTLCSLHEGRTQTVFGVGHREAKIMLIGEAPGAEEDRRGEPFVGPAGQLLNAMLRAIGYARDDVFIANILKCRPPGNRNPSEPEAAACTPYLEKQIALVAPRVLVAVGRISAQWLLQCDTPVGTLRGRVHRYAEAGIPLVVTYHPAYLLRSPAEKGKAWQDLCMIKELAADETADAER